MFALRRLLLSHRAIAALVIALALAVRLVVPTGFMPTMADGRISVSVCSDTGSTTMVVTIPGLKHGGKGKEEGGKHAQPCAFAGLGMPGLAGADPLILALALVFAMAAALRPISARDVAAPAFLRPPLRAPPTIV